MKDLPLRTQIHLLARSLAESSPPEDPDDPHWFYNNGYHDATTSIGNALLNLIGESL
jgi:hypothetical protein